MILSIVNRYKYRIVRIRHHLLALLKYPSAKKILNIIRIELERVLGFQKVSGYPYVALIDPSSICNLRCPTCPTTKHTLPIEQALLSFDSFKKVFDQFSDYLAIVDLYNWGEPFLNKEILKIVNYIHRKRVFSVISSNMNVLPPGGAPAIISSGLDKLVVSCDGLTQDTYAKYRINGSLDNVVSNLDAIAKEKKKQKVKYPLIEFQYLAFKHNQHEIHLVEDFAKSHGVNEVRICSPIIPPNPYGLENSDLPGFGPPQVAKALQKNKKGKKISCYWPWRAIVINSDGTVDPCCLHSGKNHFGNLVTQDFQTVWNGIEYQQARLRITGKPCGSSLGIVCMSCNGLR